MVPLIQSFLFSSNNKDGIDINKTIKADFIDSDKKTVLLFFGYVGCEDVCTPILYTLSDMYESKEFSELKKDVEIIFVNLTPEIEEFQPDLFAKFFNKDFKGIHLSRRDILRIDRNFGVFFSRDLSDKTELNHSDHVYLIENDLKSKKLKKIFTTHPLKTKKLINAIIQMKIKSIEAVNEKNN